MKKMCSAAVCLAFVITAAHAQERRLSAGFDVGFIAFDADNSFIVPDFATVYGNHALLVSEKIAAAMPVPGISFVARPFPAQPSAMLGVYGFVFRDKASLVTYYEERGSVGLEFPAVSWRAEKQAEQEHSIGGGGFFMIFADFAAGVSVVPARLAPLTFRVKRYIMKI
jgi:hypothetical protein